MMDLRKRIFSIIGLALVLIFAIVLVIWAPWSGEGEPIAVPEETTDAAVSFEDETLDLAPSISDPTSISSVLANEDADERYVRQLAIDFVERFGSFSNQNRNAHIDDVLPLVTEEMASWVSEQLQSYSDEYSGSTTNVFVSRVDAFADGQARISIEAQQVLESKTNTERVYNTGVVTLELVGDVWKISGLFWD